MDTIFLLGFLLFGFTISGSQGQKARPCQSCLPLTPKECPLINECNVCTKTDFTRSHDDKGCLEATITCSTGSRVIIDLHNGQSISRKAASLGSFTCQSNGHWQLKGSNYTERHVKTASCYTAAPDRQNSPIDLDSLKAVRDLNLDEFLVNYASNDGDSINWGGNATTFTIKSRPPYQFTATQTDGITYHLYQMHAHWGHRAMNGSEHTVDGKRYVAEFHFVHYDAEYGTFDNAVGKENGIAVIGVLAELGSKNSEFDKILKAMKKGDASDSHGSFAHTANGIRFNYKKMIPNRNQFFTYTGSLTTGDYNTCVDWTVMRHPITISEEQMEILYAFVEDNFREIQPILPDTSRKPINQSQILLTQFGRKQGNIGEIEKRFE